jgi:hypothetical protein
VTESVLNRHHYRRQQRLLTEMWTDPERATQIRELFANVGTTGRVKLDGEIAARWSGIVAEQMKQVFNYLRHQSHFTSSLDKIVQEAAAGSKT